MAADFATRLLAWYDAHGRKDLPWQSPRTPYRVWLSEVMLQQTQVATVIPYFERFVRALPDLRALAAAPVDDVLALWSGLGYYSRARNLHAAARTCVERHGGELPAAFDALAALRGIGRSTAGAILAQAHGTRVAILDGNVRRVLSRWRAVDGDPAAAATQRELWALADSLLPDARLADYTQAQMDLGATVCVRAKPKCDACPLAPDCVARRERRVDELPRARRAKKLAEREAWLLLLHDADARVLLVRRPPAGIWGGLWCLPEATDVDAARAAALRIAPEAHGLAERAGFEHTFSHFRLHARVLAGSADATPRGVADADARWYSNDDLDRLGLPQPIRAYLLDLPGIAAAAGRSR